MKKQRYGFGSVVLSVAFLILLFYGFDESAAGNSAKQKEFVYDMVREAAVTCYSVEGFYPKDFVYLEEHYGVKVDETRYLVHYEWVADNLYPDIQIFEKGE